jgi:hypothetical protein
MLRKPKEPKARKSILEALMRDMQGTGAQKLVLFEKLKAANMYYPNRVGEIFLVHQSPRHRWVYFSEMDRREALVFKQYDSQVSGVPRFTPHCAFDLPEIPPDAPLRASIEIRCLVTYG